MRALATFFRALPELRRTTRHLAWPQRLGFWLGSYRTYRREARDQHAYETRQRAGDPARRAARPGLNESGRAACAAPPRRGGNPGQGRSSSSPLRPVRKAWASSRRSKTCGAMLRAEKASPSLARRNALVA
jgi:hypothetical protein